MTDSSRGSLAKSVRTSHNASPPALVSTVVSIVRLGIDVLCQEAGHEYGELVRALRFDVVSGAVDDRRVPIVAAATIPSSTNATAPRNPRWNPRVSDWPNAWWLAMRWLVLLVCATSESSASSALFCSFLLAPRSRRRRSAALLGAGDDLADLDVVDGDRVDIHRPEPLAHRLGRFLRLEHHHRQPGVGALLAGPITGDEAGRRRDLRHHRRPERLSGGFAIVNVHSH